MKLSGLTIVAPPGPRHRATALPAKPPPSTRMPPLADRGISMGVLLVRWAGRRGRPRRYRPPFRRLLRSTAARRSAGGDGKALVPPTGHPAQHLLDRSPQAGEGH